jgi:intein/homing endonuclease
MTSKNVTEVNHDMSFSMFVESKNTNNNKTSHFSTIEKRSKLKWVDNNSVTQCVKSNIPFGYSILGNGRHHCIAEGSNVTLSDGTSCVIEEMGEMLKMKRTSIYSWNDKEKNMSPSEFNTFLNQGENECLEIILEDGRSLVVTNDHQVLTANSFTKAQDLVIGDKLVCSAIEGVKTIEHNGKEYILGGPNFNISNREGLLKSMAFARLCGFCMTDGHLDKTPSRVVFLCGSSQDADAVCKDIEFILELKKKLERPKMSNTGLSTIYRIELHNKILWNWFNSAGVTSGSKTEQGILLPKFIWDVDCPICIKIEFVAGWLGGDGCRPSLSGNVIKMDNHLLSINARKDLSETSVHSIRKIIEILRTVNVNAELVIKDTQGFIKGLHTIKSKSSPQQLQVNQETFEPILDTCSFILKSIENEGKSEDTLMALVQGRGGRFSVSLKRLIETDLITRTDNIYYLTQLGKERLTFVNNCFEKYNTDKSLLRITTRIGFNVRVGDIITLHKNVGFRYCLQKQSEMTVAASYRSYMERLCFERLDIIHKVLDECLLQMPHLKDPRNNEIVVQENIIKKYIEKSIKKVIKNSSTIDPIVADSIGVACITHLLDGSRKTFDPSTIGKLASQSLKTLTFPEFLKSTGFDWDSPSREVQMTFCLKIINIKNVGIKSVYDISVPSTECFVANGIIVHNCRLCGSAFCSKCSSHKAIIPEYMEVPIPDFYEDIHNVPVRVCDYDYERLTQIKALETLIIVFNFVDIDIYDLKALGKASLLPNINEKEKANDNSLDGKDKDDTQEMNMSAIQKACQSGKMIFQLVNYHLSKIREMQYYLPNHKYSEYDRKNLWSNRHYFVGHSKWMVQLLRSINFKTVDGLSKIPEASRLMNKHLHSHMESSLIDNLGSCNCNDCSSNTSCNECNTSGKEKEKRNDMCWGLMCTRDCVSGFIPSDAIQLLNDVAVPELRKIVMECLDMCSTNELSCYLQLLAHYLAHENVRLDKAILGHFLISKATNDIIIANELYMLLRSNIHSNHPEKENYIYFLNEWIKHVPDDFKKTILKGEALITTLERENTKQYRFSVSDSYKKVFSRFTDTSFPTNPEKGSIRVLSDEITVKTSITRPIMIPGVTLNGDKIRILYKNEDVRKDKIMMDVIRLMNIILTKELGIDLNIVTYNVIPCTSKSGIIEIVDKSDTLYSITKKGVSLLNYALENNENAVVVDLRQKFVRSCASYCVITFLLGIGDRHLENIMMTKDGQLFHIDYGFVLGYDPKPIEIPMMRISSEMINALGGENSKYFEEFKILCNQIYSCLRRHVNLFYSMLNLLVELQPPVQNSVKFEERKLVEEIMKRFIPGEGDKEAKIQLDNRIANGTQSYRHAIIDFFHYHAQENSTVKAISEFISKLSKIKII